MLCMRTRTPGSEDQNCLRRQLWTAVLWCVDVIQVAVADCGLLWATVASVLVRAHLPLAAPPQPPWRQRPMHRRRRSAAACHAAVV